MKLGDCFTRGTSDIDLRSSFGWEPQVHWAKVALAADLVAIAHNVRFTVDGRVKGVSGDPHAASAA
jgi:hypothetical protein